MRGCATHDETLTSALGGVAVQRAKDVLHVGWPPLYADWLPHVGPGTPAAPTVAVAGVVYGPALAARCRGGACPAVDGVMSKAERERIWLPFAMRLLTADAFLDRSRARLTAQAPLALLLNRRLLAGW